jgi:hypothetical protein
MRVLAARAYAAAVGVDFYMRDRRAAEAAGVDPHFHLTWRGMALGEGLLERQGVLDTNDPGPALPPNVDQLDDAEYERVYEAAFRRWEAEHAVRAGVADEVKVPANKFWSNEGWALSERQCRVLADAVRASTVEDLREVFESDPENMRSYQVWGEMLEMPAVADTVKALQGERPPLDEYVAELHAGLLPLADYLEAAASYLGTRTY